MPILQLQNAEQIEDRLVSLTVNGSNLTDISETSSFRSIHAAVARDLDEVYYQLTRLSAGFDLRQARGEDLDARATEIAPGLLKRLRARFSLGAVVFHRASSVGDLTIPAGQQVKTADGKVYRTTRQTTILDGANDSDTVPVQALTIGLAGNTAAGTITKFSSNIPGVQSVTNPASTVYGRDNESDDEFLARILNYIASLSRCSIQALEFAAVGVEDTDSGKQVVFAHVFEDPINPGKAILFVDDGAGTAAELASEIENELVTAGLLGPGGDSAVGGEQYLYVEQFPIDVDSSTITIESSDRGALSLGTEVYLNPTNGLLFFDPPLASGEQISATYTPFDNLIPAVQRVIDGDRNDRVNFPGYRAGGVQIRVLSPIVVPISVEGSVSVQDGYVLADVLAEVEDAIITHINQLGISGDVVKARLIERIMSVPGVNDTSITVPANNLTIYDHQIARMSAPSVNVG